MELIERITVGAGGQSNITFSNIPDTFTDLVISASIRGARSNTFNMIGLNFNGVSTNLSSRILQGNGSSAISFSQTDIDDIASNGNSSTAGTFGSSHIYIPNYRSAVAKAVSADSVSENNATEAFITMTGGQWNSVDPITSITIINRSADLFLEHSSAALYGIKRYNADALPKASGGIISYDSENNNWVHVFTASGTFTPSENLNTANCLIIGGGGAGGGSTIGSHNGGGGGAGEFKTTSTSLSSGTQYAVTVGAGGALDPNRSAGADGTASSFVSISAVGGGGGGGAASVRNGRSGGSGGGGASTNSGGGAGGSSTASGGGFGNAGGTGGPWPSGTGAFIGGGGGGAGSAGSSPSTGQLFGGTGRSSSISGVALGYAGGGAPYPSNSVATDGGGSSPTSSAGGSGYPGLGGGGGAGGNDGAGGNGGSGTVIISYPA